MDIVEFFQQSAGKWASMRTSHYSGTKPQESGKSTIEIALLEKSDPSVIQLCELHQIDANQALCGLNIVWDGLVETTKEKQAGSTLLVAIADPDANSGKLLQKRGTGNQPSAIGRYEMTKPHELTLTIADKSMSSSERIWFESENVRLRHSTLEQGGFSMASFCSEIRMGVTKLAQPADAAAAKN